MAESSYIKDFTAGVDPTGILTFKNSIGNEKNHTKHKLVGNIGAFLGGGAISIGLSAAGIKGLSKAFKNKNPQASRLLADASSDAFSALNPRKVKKAIKDLPEAASLHRRTAGTMNKIDKNMQNLNALDVKQVQKLILDRKAFEVKNKMTSDKALAKSMGVLSGAAAGVLGGGLASYSANSQYNSAQRIKKKFKTKTAEVLYKIKAG